MLEFIAWRVAMFMLFLSWICKKIMVFFYRLSEVFISFGDAIRDVYKDKHMNPP